MEYLAHYGLFFAETLTIVVAITAVLLVIAGVFSKDKNESSEGIKVTSLNKKYEKLKSSINQEILSKDEFKKQLKAEKKKLKTEPLKHLPKTFVIDFKGDIKVTSIDALRQEISAILSVASPSDEVVILIESPGGMVPHYGLAASQLARIRHKKIPLIVCVDKIAASGGYLMACVANHIVSAPFAYIGSIGVVAQLPNFHKFLKKRDIDFEQITAGEYKRTLTVFGENTEQGRKKFKEDIEDVHHLFQEHITEYRPQCDLNQVATGEHWPGKRALDLHLVDQLMTSDDYLISRAESRAIYQIQLQTKPKWMDKISNAFFAAMSFGQYH